MRNSSLATGEKNRLGVRREALSLRGPNPALGPVKTADIVQEVFAPEGQVEEGYSGSQGGVAVREDSCSPGRIHLNEQDTKRRAVRGLVTTAAEGSGKRIRTESFDPNCPV